MYHVNDAGAEPTSTRGSHGALTPGSRGVWCFTSDPVVLHHIAASQVDWIALDAQHGAFDRRRLIEAGRVLTSSGHLFAVRVGSVNAAEIGLALDIGASTVIVPQVETARDAEAIVTAAHYPPLGGRSWGPFAPLWRHATAGPETTSPQVAVMIESARALANVASIASVPGVDMLFVGPFDLALSLGEPLDELVADTDGALAQIRAAAAEAKVETGVFAGTPDRARVLAAHGFDCLAVTTDTAVISAGVEVLLGSALDEPV